MIQSTNYCGKFFLLDLNIEINVLINVFGVMFRTGSFFHSFCSILKITNKTSPKYCNWKQTNKLTTEKTTCTVTWNKKQKSIEWKVQIQHDFNETCDGMLYYNAI